MKKLNLSMIVGKKQIILASLVLILAVAIYLNWQFAGQDFNLTGELNNNSEKNYGDTALVGNNNDSYFAEARTNRQKSRDEASETITNLLKDSKLSQEEMANATEQALQLTMAIENEGKIENLVKAKGFSECVTYLDGVNCNVTVKTEGLTSEQAAQIKDIVLTNSQIEVENITITEVK